MRLVVIPDYKDIFDDRTSIEDLLIGISSATLIPILSWINAQLHNAPDDKTVDDDILNSLMARLPEHTRDTIKGRCERRGYEDRDRRIFTALHVTYFLHYELNNYRAGPRLADTQPEHELNIIKAYLLIVSKYNERNSVLPEVDRQDRHYFLKRTWPSLTIQHEFNRRVDPAFEMMKLHLLFNYLENGKYVKCAQQYYEIMGCSNLQELVHQLAEVMKKSFDKTPKGDKHFYLTVGVNYFPILDHLSHSESIQNDWEAGSLLSMKAKPLFKAADGEYCVLNWDFFYSAVYEAVLRDLHKRTDLARSFPKWENFKSDVALEVIERKMFRAVMKLIFNSRHDVLHFDEDGTEPDCYARTGRYVFLFEMKDTGLGERIQSNFDYDALIQDLERKFVGTTEAGKKKPKATRQLLRYIDRFFSLELNFDDLRRVKHQNVLIYPIVVYSGYHFSMPGINEYVNESYELERKHNSYALTMISLEYLFLNAVRLRKRGLRDLLNTYHKKRKQNMKKFIVDGGADHALKAYSPIEESSSYIGTTSYNPDPRFLHDFFRAACSPMN